MLALVIIPITLLIISTMLTHSLQRRVNSVKSCLTLFEPD